MISVMRCGDLVLDRMVDSTEVCAGKGKERRRGVVVRRETGEREQERGDSEIERGGREKERAREHKGARRRGSSEY